MVSLAFFWFLLCFCGFSKGVQLLRWELDLRFGVARLCFDAPVVPSETDVAQLTLHAFSSGYTSHAGEVGVGGGAGQQLDLQLRGQLEQAQAAEDSENVTITLLRDDYFELLRAAAFWNHTEAALSVGALAFRGVDGDHVQPILPTNPLPAHRLVPDTEPPMLAGFDLDMDAQLLVLTFSEPVLPDSLLVHGIVLQSAPNLVLGGSSFQLTDAGSTWEKSSTDTLSIAVHLGAQNFKGITGAYPLAADSSHTFLSAAVPFVQDLQGNALATRMLSSIFSIAVSNFVPDQTKPALESFDFDMSKGVLTMQFSESMKFSEARLAGISLQDAATPALVMALSPDDVGYTFHQSTATLNFSDTLVIRLKEFGLWTGESTTFLSIGAGSFRDMQNLELDPVLNMPVREFVNDDTPPMLMHSVLNLTSKQLQLTFSEPIDPKHVHLKLLWLQSDSVFASDRESINLRYETFSTTSQHRVLVIMLTANTFNTLKTSNHLASSRKFTYLVAKEGAVRDRAVPHNDLPPIPFGDAMPITRYVPDRTPPALQSSHLDMNSAVLRLRFDEPIVDSSCNASTIQLQSTAAASTGSFIALIDFEEPACRLVLGSLNEIQLQLSHDIIWKLKSAGICTTSESCFLSMGANVVHDTPTLDDSGNGIVNYAVAIPSCAAVPVTGLAADIGAPLLVGATLVLQHRTLTLVFDEPINASALEPSELSVFPAQNGTEKRWQLTRYSYAQQLEDTSHVEITLSSQDLLEIRELMDTEFLLELHAASCLIADVSRNCLPYSIVPLVVDDADTAAPFVTAFTYDEESAELSLYFSEPVDIATFQLSSFWLQRSRSSGPKVVIINTSDLHQPSASSITFEVNETLLNDAGVGASQASTFLSASAGGIFDLATPANPLLPIPSSAALQEGPVVTSCMIDMTIGSVIFETAYPLASNISTHNTFDSVVVSKIIAAFPRGKVRLQSAENITADETYMTRVTTLLVEEDKNRMKLAGAVSPAALWFSAGAIIDHLGNEATPQQIACEHIWRDTIAPSIIAFWLNLENGMLELAFDEPIAVEEIDLAKMALVESDAEGAEGVSLQDATITPFGNATMLKIDLARTPAPTIRDLVLQSSQLGQSVATTYLRVYGAAFQDLSNPPNLAKPHTVRAAGVIADTSIPTVLGFDLDLNAAEVLIDVSESIDLTSVQLEGIAVVNEQVANPAHRCTLSNSTVQGTLPTNKLKVSLGMLDKVCMQAAIPHAFSGTGDTFLELALHAVRDLRSHGNWPLTRQNTVRARTYVPDVTAPMLLSWGLNLNDGLLALEFDEAMSCAGVVLTGIAVQFASSISDPKSTYPLEADENTRCTVAGNVIYVSVSERNSAMIKYQASAWGSFEKVHITLSPRSIRDTSGNWCNPVNSLSAIPTRWVTPDTTGPQLRWFTITKAFVLNLVFDEPVDTKTVVMKGLRFVSGEATDLNQTGASLSEASTVLGTQQFGRQLQIRLGAGDVSAARTAGALMDQQHTFIVLQHVVQDVSGNWNQIKHEPPQLGPAVHAFSLDMNKGRLTLRFTEGMRGQLTGSELTLHGGLPNSPSVTLSGTSLFTQDVTGDSSYVLELLDSDMHALKWTPGLAESSNTTFLSYGGASDFEAVSTTHLFGSTTLATRTVTDATPCSEYVADSTAPVLIDGHIDLNTGNITLLFDEPVNISTFQPNRITFHSEAMHLHHTLSSRVQDLHQHTPRSIEFTLSPLDLTTTKQVLMDSESAWLMHHPFIADMATPANYVAKRDVLDLGVQISVAPDVAPPTLMQVKLDLNTGVLVLQFDEDIHTGCLPADAIAFVSASNASCRHNLSDATLLISHTGAAMQWDLGFLRHDLDGIKTAVLLCGSQDLNISLDAVVEDLAGNVMNETELRIRTVDVLVHDGEHPSVLSFTLENDIATVFFSEPVAVAASDSNTFKMRIGDTQYDLKPLPVPNVDFAAMMQMQILGAEPELDPSPAAVLWVVNDALSNPVVDTAGNVLLPVDEEHGIPVGPVVVALWLDMNVGRVWLSLSNPVIVDTIELDAIALVGANSSLLSFGGLALLQPYNFADAVPNDNIAQAVTVVLSPHGLNVLKTGGIGTRLRTHAQLIVEAGAVHDLHGLTSRSTSVWSKHFIPDSTGPVLEYASLDMGEHTLTLTFDEPVQIGSIVVSDVQLQSAATASLAVQHRLSSGAVTPLLQPAISTNVTIQLGHHDIEQLKLRNDIATSINDSFIAMSLGAVKDVYGNPSQVVDIYAAKQVDEYIDDTQPPVLLAFDLDWASASVTLTFDEPVLGESVDATRAVISDGYSAINAAHAYALLPQSLNASNGATIAFQLLPGDEDAIRGLAPLATSRWTTYFTALAGFVADMSNNSMTAMEDGEAMLVRNFLPDSSVPVLLSCAVDMASRLLTLQFSEPVALASIRLGEVQLQSTQAFGATTQVFNMASVDMSGIRTHGDVARQLELSFDEYTTNVIASTPRLLKSQASSFISLTDGAFMDSTGNRIRPILHDNALGCESFLSDTTSPTLLHYDLDMAQGELHLSFSEYVEFPTQVLSAMTLQSDRMQRPDNFVRLTSSAIRRPPGWQTSNTVTLTFPSELLVQIKYRHIARTISHVFLTIDSDRITDVFGNKFLPIQDASRPGGQPVRPASYIPDTSPPLLLQAFIDRKPQPLTLTLRFDEPVMQSTNTASSEMVKATVVLPGGASVDVPLQQVLRADHYSTELTFAIPTSCVFPFTDVAGCDMWLQDLFAVVHAGTFVDFAEAPNSNQNATVAETSVDCSACPYGSYTARSCTATENRECAICSPCPAGRYALAPCAANVDTQCAECSECKFGTYQIAPCTAQSNRKCAPCSSCERMEYEISECTRVKDTVCGTCKQCEFLDAKAKAACEGKNFLWSMQECCKTEGGRPVHCSAL